MRGVSVLNAYFVFLAAGADALGSHLLRQPTSSHHHAEQRVQLLARESTEPMSDRLKKDAFKSIEILRGSPDKMGHEVNSDFKDLADLLLPGLQFHKGLAWMNTINFLIVTAWFLLYTRCIFTSDRPSVGLGLGQAPPHVPGRAPQVQESSRSRLGGLSSASSLAKSSSNLATPGTLPVPLDVEGAEESEISHAATSRSVRPPVAQDDDECPTPDVLIVFHHPDCTLYKDANDIVDESVFRHGLTKREGCRGWFENLEKEEERLTDFKQKGGRCELCYENGRSGYCTREGQHDRCLCSDCQGHGSEHSTRESAGSTFSTARSVMKDFGRKLTSVVTRSGGSKVHHCPTKRSVRLALLKDLYRCLPAWGFDVTCFSSINDNELFVGVHLQSKVVLDQCLRRVNTELQIRPEIVANLGIEQPWDEPASSPPFVRYGTRLNERLPQHVFEGIDEKDDKKLFKLHHDKFPDGCVVTGQELIRIIFRELSGHLNLDALCADRIILDWYPVHSELWLNAFKTTYASRSRWIDLTFVQPMHLIQDYYGQRIAFAFGWNGFYCKMLLALLPMIVLSYLAGVVGLLTGSASFVNEQNRSVVFPCVVIIAWCKISMNLWSAEQEWFIQVWGGDHAEDGITRPQFFGSMARSPLDLKRKELQYPAHLYTMRRLCASLVTLLFCVLVGVAILSWVTVFAGRMNIVSSIFLSVQIKVFEVIFNHLCDIMTEWENHKYQANFMNSYLWKQFLFQAVNHYAAFFFLAIKQAHSHDGCGEEGCLEVLKKQLSTTLLILAVCRIAEVFFRAGYVKWQLWYETYQLPEVRDGRTFEEDQSKFDQFRVREQVENMCQLVLSLGYILLFGAIAPVIILYCFVHFAIQLHSSWYLLTNCTKRPLPRKQHGIGSWQTILSLMMHIGVMFSGYLFVEFGVLFQGAPVLTKITGILIFCIAIFILWILLDLVWPSKEPDVHLLEARRRYTERVLMETAETTTGDPHDKHEAPGNSSQSGAGECSTYSAMLSPRASQTAWPNHSSTPVIPYSKQIAVGDWKAIQRRPKRKDSTLTL